MGSEEEREREEEVEERVEGEEEGGGFAFASPCCSFACFCCLYLFSYTSIYLFNRLFPFLHVY